MFKRMKMYVRSSFNKLVHQVEETKYGRLLKASMMLKQAMDEAEEKHTIDGHRYFVIYDNAQDKLICITYDKYKDRGDSYQYLARRGRFLNRLTREQMLGVCFYYTGSKNGAPKCSHEEYLKRLHEWQNYYIRLGKVTRTRKSREIVLKKSKGK